MALLKSSDPKQICGNAHITTAEWGLSFTLVDIFKIEPPVLYENMFKVFTPRWFCKQEPEVQ